jgi:hypothetical protein
MNLSYLQVAVGVAFALAIFGQAGYLAVRIVTARDRPLSAGETVSLSFGFGVGLVTFEMLLFGMARVRFSLAGLLVPWVLAWSAFFAAGFAGWLRAPASDVPQTKEPTRTSLVCALLIAGFAVFLALLLLRSTFHPVDTWDAVAFWDLKARAFFIDRGILPFVNDRYYDFAHLEYPQLVPLAGTLLYLCLGQPHEAVQVVPVAFFAALLVQFHGVLRRETASRLAALVLTAGLALMPNLLYWAYNFQAESALAYYAFTTAAFFYLFLQSGRRPFLLVSALSGAFLTQTKIEGLFFLFPALAVLGATAVRRRSAPQARRDLPLFVAVVLVVSLPWLAYRKLAVPYDGLLSSSIAYAGVHHLGDLPRVLATVLAWMARPDMGAMGLVFIVLAVLVAVERHGYVFGSPRGYLLGFLAFALVPYVIIFVTLPRSIETSLSRYLLVGTVITYFTVALHLARTDPSQGRRWTRDLIGAGAGVLVALVLSQSVLLSRGLTAQRATWTFPVGSADWVPAPSCLFETVGPYLKAQPIGNDPYFVTTARLDLDTVANGTITFVAKGAAGTASSILVHWRAKGNDRFLPGDYAATRVDWTGMDQRIEISPGWHGVIDGLNIGFNDALRPGAGGPLFIRSIETGPRLASTLAAVLEGAGAGSLGVFALAALFAFVFAGTGTPRPAPVLALVWAVCAALVWFLPDLWLGAPSGQYSRPLSLAREIWREAEAYWPAPAAQRAVLIEAEHGRREFGEALEAVVRTCPDGELALFVEPRDDGVEDRYALLRGTFRFYPHRVLIVVQPARVLSLLQTGTAACVITSRHDLPAELLQSPVLYRGATWTAVRGPATASATGRTWLVPKFSRPPARSSPGVFRPSHAAWELLNARPRGTRETRAFAYGGKDDVPVAGDWDGDGVDTVGVYRRGEARFELRSSNGSGPPDLSIPFGRPGDIPIVGDWDGDGVDNIGVFRPSKAVFLLGGNATDQDTTVRSVVRFGVPSDVPISGDWDGDGVDEIGVFRPATATFYLRAGNAPEESRVTTVALGIGGDEPVVGDWDGDGIDTVGVYRPSVQLWFLSDANKTSSQPIRPIAFGRPGNRPIVGAWQGSSWWALE